MDRRERSEIYIRKLRVLALQLETRLLPLVALLQHNIEMSYQDAGITEDIYYNVKRLQSQINRSLAPMFLDMRQFLSSALDGMIECRKVQAQTIVNLLDFMRRSLEVSQEGQSVYLAILAMIESVNGGLRLLTERHRERAKTLHSAFMESLQFHTSLDEKEATIAMKHTLSKTQEILEKQNETAAAAQETAIRTQGILTNIHTLSERTGELSAKATQSAKLMAIVAMVTFIFLPAASWAVSTVSRIYEFVITDTF